jgi:MOSC domain-containing protein YiiM
LIEIESIEALVREKNVEITPSAARRNLVTRGVPLNHLVGCEFHVGIVRLRGTRLCEPCQYLEGLTTKGVLAGLIHRGGLRADIISGGTIRVGDLVTQSKNSERR